MQTRNHQFAYELHENAGTMYKPDRELLLKARAITQKAYAPYSRFLVGAAAVLQNGELIFGTNQENAAYPVGICAERVLLSVAAMQHAGIPIEAMAVSYRLADQPDGAKHPISPCGMCRQYISEYEQRVGHPIRLILSGMEGEVFVFEKASQLLPFSFTSKDLG